MNDTVHNLPAKIYEKCRVIDMLHDLFVKGIDPFFVETDEVKRMISDNIIDEENVFAERENQPVPNISVNLQELYNLTQMIQDEIWNVTRYRPTGKIKLDRINQQLIDNFLESGIDNYTIQLEIFIKSLIIDDGWSPERFRGYPLLLKLISETTGRTKMNHLQALLNKTRIMIPPNISTTPIHVIEPSISKSSNPSDA